MSARTVLLQPEDSPPVLARALAHLAAEDQPVETIRSQDNRVFAVAIPKREAGVRWQQARLLLPRSPTASCGRALKAPVPVLPAAQHLSLPGGSSGV